MWTILLPVLVGGTLTAATSLVTLRLASRRQDSLMAVERSAQLARDRRSELKETMLSVLVAAWNLKLAVTDEWQFQYGGTLLDARKRADEFWQVWANHFPEVELLVPDRLKEAIFEFSGYVSKVSFSLFESDAANDADAITILRSDKDFADLFSAYSESYDALVEQARETLASLSEAQRFDEGRPLLS